MRSSSTTGHADGGLTMIEVTVSMALMSVVMAIFTTGVLQVYRTMNKTESLSIAQTQVLTAFQRLDREVRYASAISNTASTTTDSYVEYLLADGGTGTCVELWLQPPLLKRREWANGSDPKTGTWAVLIGSPESKVGAGATPPFLFTAGGTSSNYQGLRISLAVTVGTGSSATVRESQVSFTALNSPNDNSTPTICIVGRDNL